MTDRELLELAAKAAGLDSHYSEWAEYVKDHDSPHYTMSALHRPGIGGQADSWNPLVDDSDALRLACGQSADIFINQATVRVEIGDVIVKQEIVKGDKVTAVRRAIVRAAAEIGKRMK